MAMTTTVRHHSSADLHHACDIKASLVSTEHVTEVYARLAPIASGTSRNACDTQTRVLYDALGTLLHELSAQPDHVLVEKVFFRNLRGDYDDFDQIRREFYRKQGLTGDCLPAITCLGQPPCRSGVDIELQIYAVIPTSLETASVETLRSPRENLAVKLVEVGSARHLYLSNVTGQPLNGGESEGFRAESDRMFRVARDILAEHGTSFKNAVRTWIYLTDIDADYAELMSSQDTFFAEEKVMRFPASTWSSAVGHPSSARCALDVYALLTPEVATVEAMTAPTLDGAAEYGPALPRGIKMALRESTHLFVSSTASVNAKSETGHEGDDRGQLEGMLLNMEELLHAQGAAWSDLAQAVTYLKSPDCLELYEELLAERGGGEIPHTIVCAKPWRQELLSAMEAVAVIPPR